MEQTTEKLQFNILSVLFSPFIACDKQQMEKNRTIFFIAPAKSVQLNELENKGNRSIVIHSKLIAAMHNDTQCSVCLWAKCAYKNTITFESREQFISRDEHSIDSNCFPAPEIYIRKLNYTATNSHRA